MTILRPAKTPGGAEVRTVIKHITSRLLKTRKRATIVWRGDGHYCRAQAMEWCDDNGTGYIFGLPVDVSLTRKVAESSDQLRFMHAQSNVPKMRTYTSFEHQSSTWSRPRKVIARIESSMQPEPTMENPDAMRQEIDVRYIVTSLGVNGALRHDGDAERLDEGVYCQSGEAENLIKLHKDQLASDRTSCTSAVANQIRQMLVTAAFWLMHTVRATIPEGHALAKAEFSTLRLKLLKIGVRVVEHASRIRAHLPTSCPEKALFRSLALGLPPSG